MSKHLGLKQTFETPSSMLEAVYHTPDSNVVSSKGLIFLGEKLLLYQRDQDAPSHPLWLDVPGGRTGPGESPFDTYQREVFEEFGLNLDRKDIAWSRKYELDSISGKFAYFSVATLESEAYSQIIFGDEGLRYMLMDVESFLERDDVHTPFRIRAQEYLNSLSDSSVEISSQP